MDRRNKTKMNPSVDKKIRKGSSSTSSKRRKVSTDVSTDLYELKDMKKLKSNDEAFCLSKMSIWDILEFIFSRKTPSAETYMLWDEYAKSFYLKMSTCFGVNYQHLEATSENNDDENEKKLKEQHLEGTLEGDDENGKKHSTKEMSLKQQSDVTLEGDDENGKKHSTKETSLKEELRKRKKICCRKALTGPFAFGSYSSGAEPDRIPYHLYLLVKEAVDIMEINNDDLTALTLVEEKIRFFCNYFHSHLPPGWNYDRDKASSFIAGYDLTRKPRYRMDGYTPSSIKGSINYEKDSDLSLVEMVGVMSVIHSRKTPSFFKLSPPIISFYCKLCSCFGIKNYHCLEVVSEDDVCLMNTGEEPRFLVY